MSTPCKRKHVSPSGAILPENHHFPRTEGQPITIAVDRWFLESRSAPAGADSIAQARALLSNNPDLCDELGALPSGYSHQEPADFEEFFQPELSLATAETDPEWGFLEDSNSEHQAALDAIAATVAELRRGFDHTRPLSARLRFRLMAACREELRLQLAELEQLPPQINTKTDIQSVIRTAESLLRGSEPPADEEDAFREWLAEEHQDEVPDVEPGMLEAVIRSTLAGMRMAASPQALAFYRKQLVGLLARWQQVATAGGVA